MRIAVVGTGIAGLSSAYLLQQKHDIWVYEQDSRPGGHSHTVTVDHDGTRIDVDTGFMVYNERTYPNLVRWFDHLGINSFASDMSFSASINGGKVEYSGNDFAGLFAQKSNALRPRHWRMLIDILRFNRLGLNFLEEQPDSNLTIGEFLDRMRAGYGLRHHYLLPMAGSIWSAPTGAIEAFPAISFLRFFANHGLLTVNDHPVWRTVQGGSKHYVTKVAQALGERLLLRHKVIAVTRDAHGVTIVDGQGGTRHFDAVVMAGHTDQTLAVMHDADADERALLGAIKYQPNTAVVHRDPALMPKRKAAWASWNYCSAPGQDRYAGVSLTYWMNRLQNIDPAHLLFVSINPTQAPKPELTFQSISYAHPVFDQAAIDTQNAFGRIQGRGGIWYAGAWLGYGFHEDGLRAGIAAARALGARPPWEPVHEKPQPLPASLPARAVASPDF